ncbi:MAG: hypothetical protein ACT6T0_00470 [Nevskia sp.]|jgi:uncharacterized membrane protein YdcZ (DUF606 family)|uniref:hypothetical protein n=1 Tax=Nevskia sp. TaxID=1929292 RepID=UPI004036E490
MQQQASINSQKMGLWCTWIFAALTVVGWLGIGHFYAPFPADGGLDATKQWFTETHRWGTIIGCTIFYIAAGLLTPGSIQFGIMLSKIEGRFPLWSITAGVCGIFISLIIFFNCCAWIVAAYRPEFGSDVIQAWYDWSWFAFLLGWIYLAIEMIATGIVELQDTRAVPMIPRWFTWLTFAGAASLVTAAGPAFFKSGPFAYHGLFGFYLPMAVWGTYLIGTTWFMYQELAREAAGERRAAPVRGGVAAAMPG